MTEGSSSKSFVGWEELSSERKHTHTCTLVLRLKLTRV